MTARRTRDAVDIDGGYQYRALTEGYRVQRFWHHSKVLAIEEHLPPGPGDDILDVGCGSGVITEYLGEKARTVLGMDGNPRAIAWATEHSRGKNVRYRLGLVDEQSSEVECYDKIYCLEVIEHIHHAQALDMLRSFHRMLKPSGKVFLTTPNYSSYWGLLEWLLDRIHLVPKLAGDQHVAHYRRARLRALSEEAGFRVDRIATTCFLAPWMALVNWTLAERMQKTENRARLGVGAILVCVLSKGSGS
jgi:2-polyprenyl-3-methyl-5-hydroxy-6-metoxy-1,4-benzoquinol methylase